MRGKNSLKLVAENSPIKGRNSTQLARRNECIADRYFYLGNHSEKRYDAIIEQLSNEFFLSASTLPGIIQARMEQLQELKQKKASIYFFQHKWPHLKW